MSVYINKADGFGVNLFKNQPIVSGDVNGTLVSTFAMEFVVVKNWVVRVRCKEKDAFFETSANLLGKPS